VSNYKPPSSIEITVLRTHPSRKGITGVGYSKGLIMIFDVCGETKLNYLKRTKLKSLTFLIDKFSVLMKTKASDIEIQVDFK
jgi:hypothetical protein